MLRARFARAAGANDFTDTTVARLSFLAFLHDFGKLNAGFQFKVRRQNEMPDRRPRPAGHIAEALLCFDQSDMCELLGLHRIVDEWGGGVVPLMYAMLAHHGRPARRPTHSGGGPPELWRPFAGYDPHSTAKLLNARGRAWFPDAFEPGPPMPDTPALAHLFAGIVALADQLGSAEEAFEYEADPDPNYITRARRIATEVVASRHFARSDWRTDAAVPDVRTLFDYVEPRPSQQAVSSAPLDRRLLILESETGSGKTEAALLRFAALWRAGLVDGLYFAVPTRAAAKQLHDRVRRGLERLFPPTARVPTVLAVPGYIRAGDVEGQRRGGFQVFWEDEPDEPTRLARWSAESARKFLSAPAAVGTVDQVLLAGLQVKWAHFRAASLSRSLLVVDEVHASDTYMSTLLFRVLRGHLALGGHALLMSATLGSAARSKFTSFESARATPPPLRDAENAPYPALTLAAGGGAPEIREITASGPTKSVAMGTVPVLGDSESIARMAARAAREGAKVLVIRNTVTSAQAVFAALLVQGGEDVALTVAEGPALHHSRFAAEDRRRLDDAVEQVLGKESCPPYGVVVVGTQTLEQSLDIDADFLITDLCPVDVLLQRVGRLHRHARTDRARGFEKPRCVVLVPEAGLEAGLDGSLRAHGLGVTDRGGIYENLVGVEATRRLVDQHPTWAIPAMNRMLVERATNPEALGELAECLGERWLSHDQTVVGRRAARAGLARKHALAREEPFDENLAFPDLDENVRSRLGEDGPRIVLPDPLTGPFGTDVQTFNLPAHLFRHAPPSKEDIEAARAEPAQAGALMLTVGGHRLTYDRRGVRRLGA